MKHTIRNWKQLGEVMKDPKYKQHPVGVEYTDDKLTGITFETKKRYALRGNDDE